jgi:SAM-dependent methyltransferase
VGDQFEGFYADRGYRTYKKHLFNYQLRRRKVDRFLKYLAKPVLDIGCGIAPMVPSGDGIILSDINVPAMRAMADDGYATAVLDITNIGVQSESVGSVVCSEVLEHIDDDGAALDEIYRVLKPGGSLLITVPLHRYYWHYDDEFVGHRRRYNRQALIRRLSLIGFDLVETDRIGSLPERYLTLLAVRAFLRTNGRPPRPDGGYMRLFAAANGVLARALEVASSCSPEALTSIGLLYCRKRESASAGHHPLSSKGMS